MRRRSVLVHVPPSVPRARKPLSRVRLGGLGCSELQHLAGYSLRINADAGISFLARLKGNHLVSSSLYLILNSGLQAGAGFIFWIIGTHVFSVSDVGLATSLVSASLVIGFFAMLGLNSTMVRYLPGARNRSDRKARSVLITSSLLIVGGLAAVIAAGYVFLIPVISPKLDFVRSEEH